MSIVSYMNHHSVSIVYLIVLSFIMQRKYFQGRVIGGPPSIGPLPQEVIITNYISILFIHYPLVNILILNSNI